VPLLSPAQPVFFLSFLVPPDIPVSYFFFGLSSALRGTRQTRYSILTSSHAEILNIEFLCGVSGSLGGILITWLPTLGGRTGFQGPADLCQLARLRVPETRPSASF
jgi:hypothetical protein